MKKLLRRLFPGQNRHITDVGLPLGKTAYVVGDIHGEIRLLAQVLERMVPMIYRDLETGLEPSLIFLGDYIDRGPDSRSVIDALLNLPATLPAGCEVRYLRGNHEQAALDFLDDPLTGPAWLEYGGIEMLASYGIAASVGTTAPPQLRALRDSLAAALPREHLAYLRSLEDMVILGGYIFVHAGIRPGTPLERQKTEDLLWIREPFLSSSRNHGHIIVHGHTIVDNVTILANRIALDTGAYATGTLSCIRLHELAVEVLDTAPQNRRSERNS